MSSRSALAPGTGSFGETRPLRALALAALVFLLGACAGQPAATQVAPPPALPSVTATAAAAGFLVSGAELAKTATLLRLESELLERLQV